MEKRVKITRGGKEREKERERAKDQEKRDVDRGKD